VIVPAWQKKFEKIPAWWGKVGIILMLIHPAWREKVMMTHVLDSALLLCHRIKHSISSRRTESYR
jgi:hypothetical protein